MLGFRPCVTFTLCHSWYWKTSQGSADVWCCQVPLRQAAAVLYTECCSPLHRTSGDLSRVPYANPAFRLQGGGLLFCSQPLQLGTNRGVMWCFILQLLFEDLASAISLIWHPPSRLQVPVYLFIPCLSREAMWYEPFLPKISLCTPVYLGSACARPCFCNSSFLSGTWKELDFAAELSVGECCCIPVWLQNPLSQKEHNLCLLLQLFQCQDLWQAVPTLYTQGWIKVEVW